MLDINWFHGKKILITGHTGFKGTWLCHVLANAGAEVTGFALKPPTTPSLFGLSKTGDKVRSIIGDVRDYEHLTKVFEESKPEIVFHLAAQPIVRESYLHPRYTYETNVMGTVNVCECVRTHESVRSFLNVTTDKVYENREWEWGYRENEPLDGFDPYSNSKSCSELVTHSYIRSFFQNGNPACSTARAGNVIGGGDFAIDRIIPDCIRAVQNHKKIIIRNPYSIRPYQHVLEPLVAYLMIVKEQFENPAKAGFYNVGPDEQDCITTGELVKMFCSMWGIGADWESQPDGGPHEAQFLKLDCSKIKKSIGWRTTWHVQDAMERIVEWTKVYFSNGNVESVMEQQIKEFLRDNEK